VVPALRKRREGRGTRSLKLERKTGCERAGHPPHTAMTRLTKRKSSQGINVIIKMVVTNRLLLPICFLALLASCETSSDRLEARVVSPDHGIVAAVYERNCGATTDFSSMVNVQSPSDKFRGDDGVLFSARGRYDISVLWVGPKSLLIRCSGCLRRDVYREVTALGDIDVTYSLGPGPALGQ
jgi:hypothetical protein